MTGHYRTRLERTILTGSTTVFDLIVLKYRDRFVKETGNGDWRVFGSVCVPSVQGWLVSPREKGTAFTGKDAVLVKEIKDDEILVWGPNKATLNAPLLVRMCQAFPSATAILHLHEQLPGTPTVPFVVPSSLDEGLMPIPGPVYNIEGHGFIACLDQNLDIWKV